MKKVLSMLLVLVAVMSMTAFAAEPQTYRPAADGTYSIPYTEGTANKYYALLVVKDKYEADETPVISEDTVLYIDQATADANGDVSFDGWIPKGEEGTEATVYLGGTGLESPVLLGYLGAKNFVVSGNVTTDSGTTYNATVTLTDAENNVFTATSTGGAYSVEVPEGTYTFKVNVKNHLSYTDNDFAVSANVEGKDVNVLGGDIDGDGSVAFADLSAILKDYSTSTTDADIDGDSSVAFTDLSAVLKNYGATEVTE